MVFRGFQMTEGRRAMNLGNWIDRALIGLIGVAFWYGGHKVEEFSKDMKELTKTMSEVVAQMRSNGQEVADLKDEFHRHLADHAMKEIHK